MNTKRLTLATLAALAATLAIGTAQAQQAAKVSEKADALVVMEVPVTILMRARIIELATARRIPVMFWGGVADAGVLMSYGTSIADTYQRMPVVVDKILKGAKPADTPFEQVTRQEFVVNLKVARELGVTIPPEVLKRADRVIE